MMADSILGTALHYFGAQDRAGFHMDRVFTHDPGPLWRPRAASPGFDLLVSSRYFQARIFWLRGFAEQAMRIVERNVEEGVALGQALSFCSVLGQSACPITLFAGDLDAAERYGAMLLAHAAHHQIRLWYIWAECFNGLTLAKRGDVRGGLAVLGDGLELAGD